MTERLDDQGHGDKPRELTIDLDAEAWDQIKAAAKESTWMPPDYMMNDWVSDVCRLLREGTPRSAGTRITRQEALTLFCEIATRNEANGMIAFTEPVRKTVHEFAERMTTRSATELLNGAIAIIKHAQEAAHKMRVNYSHPPHAEVDGLMELEDVMVEWLRRSGASVGFSFPEHAQALAPFRNSPDRKAHG